MPEKEELHNNIFSEDEIAKEKLIKRKEKNKFGLRDFLEIVLIFLIIYAVFQFVLMSVQVNGPSMEKTYADGQRAIMVRTLPFNKADVGDVVVIDGKDNYGEDEGFVVKRIFAKGGDTFEIKNNNIYVNGKLVNDPYRIDGTFMEDYPLITLGDDEVFVLGDNRNVSMDSRMVGPIKVEDIKAVHGFTYWPLDKIGFMK